MQEMDLVVSWLVMQGEEIDGSHYFQVVRAAYEKVAVSVLDLEVSIVIGELSFVLKQKDEAEHDVLKV